MVFHYLLIMFALAKSGVQTCVSRTLQMDRYLWLGDLWSGPRTPPRLGSVNGYCDCFAETGACRAGYVFFPDGGGREGMEGAALVFTPIDPLFFYALETLVPVVAGIEPGFALGRHGT